MTLATSVWNKLRRVRRGRGCAPVRLTPSCSNTHSCRPLVTSRSPSWTRAVPTTVSPRHRGRWDRGRRFPRVRPFGFSPNSAILPPARTARRAGGLRLRVAWCNWRRGGRPHTLGDAAQVELGLRVGQTHGERLLVNLDAAPIHMGGHAIGESSGCRARALGEVQSVETAPIVMSNRPSRLLAIIFGGEQEVDGVGVHANGFACRRVDAGDIGLSRHRDRRGSRSGHMLWPDVPVLRRSP